MAPATKACGYIIRLTVREHSGMFMATDMKVNGRTTKLRVLEYTHMQTELSMKVSIIYHK